MKSMKKFLSGTRSELMILLTTGGLFLFLGASAWAWPWGPSDRPIDTGRARVHCTSDITAACGAGAGACSSNREVTLPQGSCHTLGLHEGQVAGMSALRNPTDGDSSFAYCTFMHELNHARDVDDPNQEGGATEVSSYIQGRGCLTRIYKGNCAPERNGFTVYDCSSIQSNIQKMRAELYINACAAGERPPLTCIQGCKAAVHDEPECRAAFRLYLHNFR